jgi:hypothetical protein
VNLQFIHEQQYRSELFALDRVISPQHGITRPLSLRYLQLESAAAQCCSFCGEADHTGQQCPLAHAPLPSDGSQSHHAMRVSDSDSPPPSPSAHSPHRAGVCRDCYSTEHQQTCYTPADARHCKLCRQRGHTSFRCAQYRAHWVSLSRPVESHAAVMTWRTVTSDIDE